VVAHRARRRSPRKILIALLALGGVGLLQSFVHQADAAAGASRLTAGQRLAPGEQLVSPDGRFVLTMQDDGNLVEYAPGDRPIWSADTDVPGAVALLQADGNFVVIAPGNSAEWSTETDGTPGPSLELQNDGNLVVYGGGHIARWASADHPPAKSEPEAPVAPAPPTGQSSMPSVQVAQASSAPAGTAGDAFSSTRAKIYKGSMSNPYLSGFAAADGPFTVADRIEMQVCSPKTQLCRTAWKHDFNPGCQAAKPVPEGPVFLGKYLNPGLNEVTFILRNQCGGQQGGSDIFLTGYGVVDDRLVPSNDCRGNLTRWLGGIVGKPFTDSDSYPPFIGPDGKVHGSGSVNVRHKVNCSATVRIMLQTRVCNRLGQNCNPRTIASTEVEGLPDTGLRLRELTGECRTGKDDYRVQVHVRYTVWEGLDSQSGTLAAAPALTRNDDYSPDGDQGWTSLTC
jgi:hypothetical protein